ncbi:hypothetical protein LNP59_01615 [Klebsiella pneumoniae subsp. pneumoniae]|nr:hypothetical protein [Klebsiella pneumoniae subsp. pneumoniae]
MLAASPFLHKLTGLVDDGRLAGHADLDALRQLHPQLHTFAGWLAGPGRPAFERALTSGPAGRLIVKGWCSGHPPGALSRR